MNKVMELIQKFPVHYHDMGYKEYLICQRKNDQIRVNVILIDNGHRRYISVDQRPIFSDTLINAYSMIELGKIFPDIDIFLRFMNWDDLPHFDSTRSNIYLAMNEWMYGKELNHGFRNLCFDISPCLLNLEDVKYDPTVISTANQWQMIIDKIEQNLELRQQTENAVLELDGEVVWCVSTENLTIACSKLVQAREMLLAPKKEKVQGFMKWHVAKLEEIFIRELEKFLKEIK